MGALLLLGSPRLTHSAECPSRFRIAFADGSSSCLSDHALAHDDVVGQFGADVRRVAPPNGYYAIATTPRLPQCKRAVGMGTLDVTLAAPALTADAASRGEKAVRDCRLRTRGATEECRCRLILVDGRSPLTRAEFARYADAAPAVAAAPAAPATSTTPSNPPTTTATTTPTTAPTTPTSATPTSATPGPAAVSPVPAAAPSGSAVGPVRPTATAEEIAALNRRVDELQAALARPPSTTAEPVRARQRARALVIGNGRYAHLGTLPNPKRDAEAIAAKLRGFGIEVDLHLDTDRPALVRALAAFQARAAGYDVNILFYAGHGLQVAGINYIVPVEMNAEGATVGAVKLNGVSLDDALDYLPAATRLVFLDACRDNPIARSLRSTRSGAGVGLAPVSTVSGTLLSYATRDGSTAEDGTGTNSPYTTALLRHLDADEDIALVLRRVRQAVLQATGQRQEPWEYGSLVGEQLVLSRLAR
ncbi:MAG: caspase family protein [Burkholderiales bacterium]|nr:caspase family protein [Burkholderiales bacterium]